MASLSTSLYLQDIADFVPSSRVSEGLKVVIGKLVLLTHINKDKKSVERRDILTAISENRGVLQGFIFLLETCDDAKVCRHVICLLRELLSIKSSYRSTVLPILVGMNLSITLIKSFINLFKTQDLTDHSIGCVFWVLSALASKDTKFSIKIRLCEAVKPISTIFRFTLNKSKLIYPIIQVIRALSRNVLTAAALGKDGIIPLVVCIIDDNFAPDEASKKHLPKLKSSLECFLHLTKSKSNLLLMTKHGLTFGGVNILAKILEIFKHKRLDNPKAKLILCLLSILHNLVSIKLGRLHFLERRGLDIIKEFIFSLEQSEERRWVKCIQRSSEILNHCIQKKVIMSEGEMLSPLKYKPHHQPHHGLEHQAFQGSQGGSRGSTPESEDDSGESDSEGGDDSDSDDNQDQDNTESGHNDNYQGPSRAFTRKRSSRSAQELQRDYGHLFKEFKLSHCHDSQGFLKEYQGLYSLPKTSTTFHYKERASFVEKLYPFKKIALPDLLMAESPKGLSESFLQRNKKSQRSRILRGVRSMLEETSNPGFPRVVYDLDSLLKSSPNYGEFLSDEDIPITGRRALNTPSGGDSLLFESRFESGNLRRASQIGDNEYNLIITPDVNTNNHCQWFYFSVSNMKTGCPYVFNIINYEKKNSQFNFGMQPVFFSSIAAQHYGSPYWQRIGSDIFYGKNEYTVSSNSSDDSGGRDAFFMTASFTFEFPYDNDVVYLAYHYPYTYTRLRVMLDKLKWKQERNSSIFYREDVLCYSLCGNEVPVLTLTSSNVLPEDKELILLTARVHPGETNASWIMEGTLVFLLSSHPEAIELRQNYIFKIVPMLNVEGVVHGSHRSGLTGEDLNRQWMSPSQERHPSIFHVKGLIDFCQRQLKKPLYLYCDYHGHSRKKNVFLYGCSPYSPKVNLANMLERNEEYDGDDEDSYEDYLELEKALGKVAPYFDIKSCKYNVEKCRETTARVVVWREFGVNRSYTMESTFCGINKGTHKGLQISTIHLHDMGSAFAKALNYIDCEYEEEED